MTIKDVAQGLIDGSLDVEEAENALRGARTTSTVGNLTESQLWLGDEGGVPDDDDVIHLDLAWTMGVLSDDDYARLLEALS